MKLIGAATLLCAGFLTGLRSVRLMKNRIRQCRELCRMLELMTFELERFRTPMPRLMEELSRQLDGASAVLCASAFETLSAGGAFSAGWERGCDMLPNAERSILRPLAPVLGRYGGAEQLDAIRRAEMQIRTLGEELSLNYRDGSRIAVGVSAAGAAFLAVLLL